MFVIQSILSNNKKLGEGAKLESKGNLVCGIYSDYLSHEAGIGNDMRTIISELSKLEIDVKWLGTSRSRFLRVMSLIRLVFLGPKKADEVNFIYTPHVIPRLYKAPHILRVHDIFPLTNPTWFRFTSTIFFKLSILTHKKSFYLFDSQSSKNSYEKYFGDVKSKNSGVMYCKIRTFPENEYCDACRACKMHTDGKFKDYGLAVGTIEPRKNYDFLLSAWKSEIDGLNAKLPLLIVGEKGWKTSVLVKKLKKSNADVVWLEKICDSSLRRLYLGAKIFVSASRAEGFNLPVEEALFFGIPVVISSIDTHREIYGNRATFFDLNSKISFGLAIKSSLMNSKNHKNQIGNLHTSLDEQMNMSDAVKKVLQL